jgi:hypothetical protein
VKEQLKVHNTRIKDILPKEPRAVPPEGIHKLLMVEEDGWLLLERDKRTEFREEIQRLGGWQIQVIRSRMIEDSGQFIDRLRKPTSK